jgi:hypothetical protein
VVAICALLAVTFVSEADTGASVLEEAAEDATSEAALYEWTAQLQTSGPNVNEDPLPKDDSAAEAVKKLEEQGTKEHQANKEARHNLRSTAAAQAAAETQKSIDAMGNDAAKMAATNAVKTAAAAVKKNMPVQAGSSIAVTSKLGLLKTDAKVLRAAVDKAEKEAADATKRQKEASDKYHAEVKADVKQTEEDFMKLNKNLDSYKGIDEKARKVQLELQHEQETEKRLQETLAAKDEQLKRETSRHTEAVQKAKDKVAASKAALQAETKEYKDKIQGLEDKLKTVQASTDINNEIATRIKGARDVVKKQEAKMAELRNDVIHLQTELAKTKGTTKDLNGQTSKERLALHLADSQYTKLTLEAEDLREKLAAPAPQVTLKTARGDNAKSSVKAVHKVVTAVKKVAQESKDRLVEAAEKSAIHAAEKAVRENKPALPAPKVSGINTALKAAGAAISGLNLDVKPKQGDANKEHTYTDSSLAQEEPEQLIQEPKIKGLNHALAVADGTLAELHLSAFDARKVHQAELLAHVAHRLFEKSMETGKPEDKAAAEAAMQKAMHAHVHLAP